MSETTIERPLRTRADALRDLSARRQEADAKGRIDDRQLPAGSPMHYYCVVCGLLAETKSEKWFRHLPKNCCDACSRDVTDGLLQEGADSLTADAARRSAKG